MLRHDDLASILDVYGLGPDGVLEGPVARGEVGQVWKLTTPTRIVAVKEPFVPPDEASTNDEATFQELGVAAGVPAPDIVRTTSGDVLAHVGDTAVRVYSWIGLRDPDRRLDTTAVADAVARLHRLGHVGANGLDPWYTEPVGRERWCALADDLRTAGAPFADAFAARIDELVALEAWIGPPTDVRTCHRDLFADNVLATDDGGICVIDWENSGLAGVSHELALVVFEFGDHDPDRIRSLHDAYRERGGPGRIDRPESFSMVIAQIGHIGEYAARRWLADRGERPRATARVEEFLDDGITPNRIELILDALA